MWTGYTGSAAPWSEHSFTPAEGVPCTERDGAVQWTPAATLARFAVR